MGRWGGSRWRAPGRQGQGLDGRGCFSLECTGEDQAHVGTDPSSPTELVQLKAGAQQFYPPSPLASPSSQGGGEIRGIGEGWVPGPTSHLLSCRHLFPGPGPMNPRPKHTTSRPSAGGGVVWGGPGRDPPLPAIPRGPAFPRAQNWVLALPLPLPSRGLAGGGPPHSPLRGAPSPLWSPTFRS